MTVAGYHQKRILRHVYVAEITKDGPVVHEIGVAGEHRTVVMLTKRVSVLGFALRVPTRQVHASKRKALEALRKKLEKDLEDVRLAVSDAERALMSVTSELLLLLP